MRIVFLSTEAGLGGAERCLEELALGIPAREASWETHVLLLGDGPLADRLRRGGIGVTLLAPPREVTQWGEAATSGISDRVKALWSGSRASAPAMRFAGQLRQALVSLRPDLVHTNGSKAHLLGAVAGVPGVPLLWHLHDFLGSRGLSRLLLPLACRRVSLAVANSKAVADDARKILKQVPVEYVHNGVDLSYFRPSRISGDWLDEASGLLPSKGPRVGLVATYARWKGHLVFLQAAAEVAKLHPEARFYIVGGAIYRTSASQFTLAELKAEAARLGLESKVGFVPFQADVSRVYRSLDIAVHASTEPEPFGRAIVEAMACGTAVIGTALGGAAEILRNESEALAVPSRDPMALASAVARLVKDPSLRAALGKKARSAVESRFSLDSYVGGFASFYRKLLEPAPAAKRVLGA
jgi:glycosyltransferase involved in cell wall biosynthesis